MIGIWLHVRGNSGAPSSWIRTTPPHITWYSHCLLALGRTEESLAESKRALELEPLQLVVGGHLGWHYLYARQYDQAIEQFRKTLELDPTFPQIQRYAAWAYLQKGMHPEAIAALRAALNSLGRDPEIEGELGHALAVAGRRTEALAMLDGLGHLSATRYVSPYSVALVHAGLGDRDQALAWLDKAYAERSDYMPYLRLEPMLDGLRSDHRFVALVGRVARVLSAAGSDRAMRANVAYRARQGRGSRRVARDDRDAVRRSTVRRDSAGTSSARSSLTRQANGASDATVTRIGETFAKSDNPLLMLHLRATGCDSLFSCSPQITDLRVGHLVRSDGDVPQSLRIPEESGSKQAASDAREPVNASTRDSLFPQSRSGCEIKRTKSPTVNAVRILSPTSHEDAAS